MHLNNLVIVLEQWASPYINHFLSADTIVSSYANPQNLNRYSYVTNNPLRYTDPTGHLRIENQYGGGCSTSGFCGGSTGAGSGGGSNAGGSNNDDDEDETSNSNAVPASSGGMATPTANPSPIFTPAPGGANNYDCFTHPEPCGTGTPSSPPSNDTILRMAEFIAGTALISGGLLITALGGLIAGIGLAEIAGLSSIAPALIIPTTLHAGPAVVIGGIVALSGVGITVVGGYLIYDSIMPSSPVTAQN